MKEKSESIVLGNDPIFKKGKKYRFYLPRILGSKESTKSKIFLFVGLNPSWADEKNNDRTISRIIKYATEWGYHKLMVGNLFPLVNPDSKDSQIRTDEFRSLNNICLSEMINQADVVLCGWGRMGKFDDRDVEVMQMIGNKAFCVGLNEDGTPSHPLCRKKGFRFYKSKMINYAGRDDKS